MCGRFTHYYTWSELHKLMSLTTAAPSPPLLAALNPRYNVAPTQCTPVVRQDAQGNRSADALTWGLVPHWAKDPAMGSRLINARSEEAAGKPSFREAVKKRRCLVPVSDFYEWQAVPGEKRKQPWAFRVKDAPLFAFAGLWERWDKSLQPLETFTILTRTPNELIAPLHNRMPVIVRPEHYDVWLDSRLTSMTELAAVIEPFPATLMEARRVSTRVNSPANDDAALIAPE
jgi:putative SOS response-associated peptidase YedK